MFTAFRSRNGVGQSSTRFRKLTMLAGLLLAGLSLWYLASVLALSPVRMMSGWPNTVMEAQPVYGTLRIAKHQPLYQDYLRAHEMVPLTYGWLLYSVPGLITRAAHTLSAPAALLAGRVQSAAAACGCVILLMLLARRYGSGSKLALFAALPLFWYPYLTEWMNDFVPDFPALCFSLAGWYMVATPRSNYLRASLAALAWVAAFHYKPTIIAGPAVYLVCEIAGTQNAPAFASLHKRALPLYLLVAGMVASCGILDWYYHGLWRFNALSAFSTAHWRLPYIWGSIVFKGAFLPLLIAVMIVTALAFIRATPLWHAYLALFAFDCLCMGKQGSNTHYLLNSFAVFGVALVVTVKGLWDRQGAVGLPIVFPTLAACTSGVLILGLPTTREVLWEGVSPGYKEIDTLGTLLRENTPDKVLCLDPYLAMLHDWPVNFADSYHASLLEQARPNLFATITAGLARRQYHTVVANYRWYQESYYHSVTLVPSGIQKELMKKYRIHLSGLWLGIFVPKE